MKKLIIFLTSFFVFSLSVSAAPTLDDYTIMVDSNIINRNHRLFYGGYNRSLDIVAFFLANDDDYKQGYIDYYGKISFCFDGSIDSFYGSVDVSDVNMIKTSKKCMYTGSSYTGGRVLDVYYKSSFAKGTGSSPRIIFYSGIDFSLQLISFVTQSQPFDQTDSLPDPTIEQNETIINQNTESENTRKGILGTLQNVFSTLGSIPGLIAQQLKGLFDNILNGLTSLGSTIGGFFENLLSGIIEGLKSLFVPTDDQLYEIVDDASKLSENFGFIGESVSFFINIFTALLGMVNANGCIELPEFTIGSTSLFDSFTFWNAQNVCLGDNAILSANINTIRTITSIALVCLFLNFASSKFFSILSKNDSGEVIDEASDGSVSVNSWSVTNGTRYNRRS